MTAQAATHAYCREARRLRGRLARRPVELYHSLRELSDRQDAAALGWENVESLGQTPSTDFANQVCAKVCGDVLPYSRRLELLARAENAGIGRFQANLIIAAVQHRLGQSGTAPADLRNPWPTWAVAAITFAAVQLGILATVWALFIR